MTLVRTDAQNDRMGGTYRSTNVSSQPTNTKKLSSLLQISQALSATPNLKAGLQEVLETLARDHDAFRSIVALVDPESGQLQVEAAHGVSRPSHLIRYGLGEGVVGKVAETGRPVVVPKVSVEPAMLHRASTRRDAVQHEETFICVPIAAHRQTVGTLGISLKYKTERHYDHWLKFYGIVGAMIGQAVKVQRALAAERQRLVAENAHLRQELKDRYDFSAMIGNSGPMRGVYQQVEQVARTNTTVLIRGESGTGKELIAHAIFYNSLRAKKPFIKVSCGALPDTLVESELFGYEKGAFTGAHERKKGRFELAEGGTLFLDEIGDVHPTTQIKLLRVLQEREFERLGGTSTVKVNVRLIAATHKDMEQAIAQGTFREDLFYRLNVFSIFVPPLRDRKADVLLLTDHFLERFAREHRRDIRRVSTPAIDMLTAYHWPGNVRELQNVVERAVLVCDGQVIHAHHLPPSLQTAEATGTVMSHSLHDAVCAYETDLIKDALKSARGNRAQAARLLRTTDRIFNYRVRKLKIDWKRFKS